MRRISFVLALSLSVGLGWSCQPKNNDSEKLAEVDGAVITRAEIDRSGGKQLQTLREQLYKLERQKLDEYIGATLLTKVAKERGVSVSTVLDQEVNKKVPPVSEEEIKNLYEKNKERIRVEFDKVHDQIAEYLRQQRVAERKSDYFNSLRAKATIKTYLEPPPIRRVDVLIKDAPSKGDVRAPVKIVKFEDFECPFCKAVQPTLAELLKKYDGKVRVIHKDLPLNEIHPKAELAAEAARCAGDQGMYWQYHDVLYKNSPKLTSDDLKAYAKDVGLKADSFDQCLASGKHKDGVQQDLNEGAKLGLTGTPAFFINGREISGAQPLEAFAVIVDEELAAQSK
jgi:protein-disulfide isomerase